MSVHSDITFIALVVVALLCGMAMARLKLPALIGYILAGVVLGRIGEFSFVLAGPGLGNGLIGQDGHRLVVTVIALSLISSPLWIDAARRLHDLVGRGISNHGELIKGLYPAEATALRNAIDGILRRHRKFQKRRDPPDGSG